MLEDADAARSGREFAHGVLGKVRAADGAGQPAGRILRRMEPIEHADRRGELLEAACAEVVRAWQLRRVVGKVARLLADGARKLLLIEVEAQPHDVIALAALLPWARHHCHLVRRREPWHRGKSVSG